MCRPDSIAWRPDVIYHANWIHHKIYNFLSFSILKQSFSINLSFAIVFYRFLSDFYWIFIVYYQISIEFLSNSIVLGRYNTLEEFYSSRTIFRYRNLQSHFVSTDDRPEIGIIAYPYSAQPGICGQFGIPGTFSWDPQDSLKHLLGHKMTNNLVLKYKNNILTIGLKNCVKNPPKSFLSWASRGHWIF